MVETDEPDNPLHIGAFGVNRVVVETEYLTDFIEELCVDFLLHPAYQDSVITLWIADNRHRAKLPKNLANITLSGQNGL